MELAAVGAEAAVPGVQATEKKGQKGEGPGCTGGHSPSRRDVSKAESHGPPPRGAAKWSVMAAEDGSQCLSPALNRTWLQETIDLHVQGP